MGWNSSEPSRVKSELRKSIVNHGLQPSLWFRIRQRIAFSPHQTTAMLRTSLGIICCGWLTCGCGKSNRTQTNAAPLRTNQIGLVSIGVLNTVDTQRQEAIVRFFASNGVVCSIEGSVVFDVMVRQADVENVHTILERKPKEDAFRSAWESR